MIARFDFRVTPVLLMESLVSWPRLLLYPGSLSGSQGLLMSGLLREWIRTCSGHGYVGTQCLIVVVFSEEARSCALPPSVLSSVIATALFGFLIRNLSCLFCATSRSIFPFRAIQFLCGGKDDRTILLIPLISNLPIHVTFHCL